MPYRDDQASLEARRDELSNDLAEMNRQADALAEAVRGRDALARELASVEGRLRRAASRRLPLLENVRVASPCSASWDEMEGDEQVRFCGKCEKSVYNLSAMSGEEAEKLIAGATSSMCVRLYRRADGTVLTADCPVGVHRKRVRRVVVAAAGAGAMAAAASTLFVQQGDVARPVAMGAMEPVSTAVAPTTGVMVAAPTPSAQPAEMGSAAPSAQPLPESPKPPHADARKRPPHHTMGALAL
jgi:hypothetical protein